MTVMPLVQNGSGRWPAELECRFALGARTFKKFKTLSQPVRKVTLWAKTGPQQHGMLRSKIHLVESGEPDLFRVEIYESDRAVSVHDDGLVITKTRHVGSWGYIDFQSRPDNEFSYFWNKPVVRRLGENPGGMLELVDQRRMIYRFNWLAPTLPDEMTESERWLF
jgi:hypothetical protein